jgi:hypothetical protein
MTTTTAEMIDQVLAARREMLKLAVLMDLYPYTKVIKTRNLVSQFLAATEFTTKGVLGLAE